MTQRFGLVDCTNDEYHSGPGVSKSHLDVIARGPRHYWHAYVNPEREPREPTEAMVQGTAIHAAILEPDLFSTEFICAPEDAPKRPTEKQRNAKRPSEATLDAIAFWDDFNEQAEGKTVLTRAQFDIAQGVRDAVHRHPGAARLLHRGKAEESFFAVDPDTGELVKCRTDWRAPDCIVDVKSTEDASPDGFLRSVLKYNYHVQVAWYRDVIEAATNSEPPSDWVFLAVEKTPPYAVGLYRLPAPLIAAGRVLARERLQRIIDCRMLGDWPDYNDGRVVDLQVPPWMERRLAMNSPEVEFA